MRILVLVKEVPDTYADRTLSLETGLAERDANERVVDEICERALEAALAYADTHDGTDVSVVTMAAEDAMASVRKALAMGAASAVQVVDTALLGSDVGLTARVLAAAISHTGFDLVITGNQSTDGSGGVMPAMIAEHLGVPVATGLAEVTIAEDRVSGVRVADGVTMRISTELPAVISVTEALPDARFPNFKGIMQAKKKPLEVLSLTDLGVETSAEAAAASIIVTIAQRPPRAAGIKIIDEGDAGSRLAEFLVANHLVGRSHRG